MNVCFAHFQLDCPICFPVSTKTKSDDDGNSQESPEMMVQVASSSPPISETKQSATYDPEDPMSVPGNPPNTARMTVPVASSLIVPDVAPKISSSGNDIIADNTGSTITSLVSAGQVETGNAAKRNGDTVVVAKSTPKKRKKKTIIDCEVALKIFRSLKLTNKFFNSGKVLAWALEPDDPAFNYIYKYVANSQPSKGCGVKVVSILRILVNTGMLEADEEDVAPVDFNTDPNTKDKLRMMLWHGTAKHAIAPILQNGLKLPSMWKPQWFGCGIYFADRIAYSLPYCHPLKWPGVTAYLFLCDVLLGKVYNAYNMHGMIFIKSAPSIQTGWFTREKCDSVRGIGKRVPCKTGNRVLDGCVWPLGKTVLNKEEVAKEKICENSEYVVYDTRHVQPKYLVKVEYTEKAHYEKIS